MKKLILSFLILLTMNMAKASSCDSFLVSITNADTSACAGDTVDLLFIVSGGTAPYYDNMGNILSTQDTFSLNVTVDDYLPNGQWNPYMYLSDDSACYFGQYFSLGHCPECDGITMNVSYDSSLCDGDTVTFTVETGGYNGLMYFEAWLNPYTNDSLAAGVHSYTTTLEVGDYYSFFLGLNEYGCVYGDTIIPQGGVGCDSIPPCAQIDSIMSFLDINTPICAGDTICFTAMVSGQAPYVYHGYFDGVPFQDTSMSNIFTLCTIADDTVYSNYLSFFVYDTNGCWDSVYFVYDPINCDSILPCAQIDSLSYNFNTIEPVCISDTICFTAIVSGQAPFVYHGYFGGVPFEDTSMSNIFNFCTIVDDTVFNYLDLFVYDANSCWDSVNFEYHVIDCGNFIKEVHKQLNISFSPNPTSTQFNLNWENALNGSRLDLINALGQTVKTINILQDNTLVNVTDVPEGLYFASVRNKNQVISTHKVVVQR